MSPVRSAPGRARAALSAVRARWRSASVAALLLLVIVVAGGQLLLNQVLTRAPAQVRQLPGVRAVVPLNPPGYAGSLFDVRAPLSVAVTPDGEFVYVAEGRGDRFVLKIRVADGVRVEELSPPLLEAPDRAPLAVAVAPSGFVYVVDRLRLTVDVYNDRGQWLGWLPAPDGVDEWQPLNVDSDADGNLYVTNTAFGGPVLVVYSADEDVIEQYASITADGVPLSFPTGVAVGKDGRLWIGDSNNGRIVVLERGASEGRAVGVRSLAVPRGIAVDPDGHIVVADVNDHSVSAWQWDSDSAVERFIFGGHGIDDRSFRFPNDVAIDARGWLYVADRDNDRVQIWR